MHSLVIDYMNFKSSVSPDGKSVGCSALSPAQELSSTVLDVARELPLSEAEWRTFFNKDGRILDESSLRKAIFKGIYIYNLVYYNYCLFHFKIILCFMALFNSLLHWLKSSKIVNRPYSSISSVSIQNYIESSELYTVIHCTFSERLCDGLSEFQYLLLPKMKYFNINYLH